MKLGIIGAGNMASAIIGGIIKKGIIPANEIICSTPVEAERTKASDTFGINVTESNTEVVKSAEVLLLAVKPQVVSVVVQWLRFCIPMQGTWVGSLVWELRSHML